MSAKKVTVMVGFAPIATRLEVAVESESSDTHAVCTGSPDSPHAPARVQQTVGCTHCGETHSSVWGFPQRGVERAGELIVLDADELKEAKGEPHTGRPGKPAIELAFHPREKVYGATVAGDSVQNMYPDRGGEKGYALLRDTLAAHPEIVACMVWAPTSVNALWVLEVVGRRIVVTKRCWPEQVRPTMEIPDVDVFDMERDMFDQLITASTEDFDLGRYVDQSKLTLEELIASRTGTPVDDGDRPAAKTPDLISALTASLDAAMKKKAPAKRVAKKAPAKKAPAKKVAAKKAVAKKTTTRKKVA